MFCIGNKISENFTLDVRPDIKQNVIELHLIDTIIISLGENFCGWNELVRLFLSHNDNLNCSTLHRTVHSCMDVYGQCEFVHTPHLTIPSSVMPRQAFDYGYSILTLCVFFIGILVTAVVVTCRQLYKSTRTCNYPITSL